MFTLTDTLGLMLLTAAIGFLLGAFFTAWLWQAEEKRQFEVAAVDAANLAGWDHICNSSCSSQSGCSVIHGHAPGEGTTVGCRYCDY